MLKKHETVVYIPKILRAVINCYHDNKCTVYNMQ